MQFPLIIVQIDTGDFIVLSDSNYYLTSLRVHEGNHSLRYCLNCLPDNIHIGIIVDLQLLALLDRLANSRHQV